MLFNKKFAILIIAVLLGVAVAMIPRPEGTRFEINGDPEQRVLAAVQNDFRFISSENKKKPGAYIVEAVNPGQEGSTAARLMSEAKTMNLEKAVIEYVDGLSPVAHRFLAILVFLIILFVFEPVPLEITAILIGVFLVLFGITDVTRVWASYMHPVVLFIMCCLIFAVALHKAGLTQRMGYAVARRAGDSVIRFTFILSISLGILSSVMHDAAATAIGIAVMIPLMRSAGVEPHTKTAKFMMISLPFACSAGGMGTLVGGGRCMVSAAFLKELTGIEINFFDWFVFAFPAAVITVPLAVLVVYFVFRPDSSIRLPKFEESIGPWTAIEIKTLVIIALGFASWLTKGIHGLDYSITGMLAVAALVMFGVLTWEDIHANLEWGTALFIFGGGLALGLAMDYSGAARYFANLFFPLVQGKGWLILFIAVGIFGAVVTNVMANVAAAALILPIVIPLAKMEGVDPRILALCMGMATSFAMLLVIGCPPNAIAYSYRQFKSMDLTKTGLVAMPVLLIALVVIAMVWWRILGLV